MKTLYGKDFYMVMNQRILNKSVILMNIEKNDEKRSLCFIDHSKQ